MKNLILLHVVLYLVIFVNAEHCEKDGICSAENDDENYKRENNIYLKKIEDALKDYVPCEQAKCSCHSKVLRKDLQQFKNITKETIQQISSRGTKYQIINNKIYRQEDCMFPSRCAGIEYFLKKILKKTKMKDMEMIINVRDYPQVMPYYGHQGPVLSFSKTKDYLDIFYPTWSFYEGGPAIKLYPTGLGRWDLFRESLKKASEKWTWEKKQSKAFFRGSRTSDERDSLVLLSREDPILVDAKYTKNQAWKSMSDTLNEEPAEEVSLENHCKFKFLFNFRGVASSFRFKHLFLCKSLVFHVGNEWDEFFYDSLKPWVHYIPVDSKATSEELKSLIKFFRKHSKISQEIANRGYDMIWNNLRMEDVECYWRKLLKGYGKLIQYDVELDTELIAIK
ncbi:unnamed protein product [Diamesa tonsa]